MGLVENTVAGALIASQESLDALQNADQALCLAAPATLAKPG